MPFFQPGQAIPDQEFRPRELVREEAWGEIWRADMRGQSVLFVAYTTPDGEALFSEAQPGIERWKDVAGSTCPHLLRIHIISDSAIPFLITEDPGDMTLREYVASEPKELPLIEQARWGKHTSLGLHEAATYDAGPVGISPDTIFRNPLDRETPWKLLPVGPTSTAMYTMLAGGKYFPPEVAFDNTTGGRINPDSFSLAWLWAQILRRDFDAPLPEKREAIPYKMLGYQLESCLSPKAGVYADPRMTAMGVERWAKKEAETDAKDLKEAKAEARRGPIGKAWRSVWGASKRVALPLLIVGVVGGGGWAAWTYRDKLNPMKVTSTTKTPMGTATLFYQAMVARDTEKIKSLTDAAGAAQTFQMLKAISDLERDGWIDAFDTAAPQVSGSGSTRSSEAMLFTRSGEIIGLCQLMIKQEQPPDGEWRITQAFFKQLVFPIPGATPPYKPTARPAGGG